MIPIDRLLPPAMRLPGNPYPQRAEAPRLQLVRRMGGSAATEAAVGSALDWLARHQSSDGRWDSQHFDEHCRACAGASRMPVDVATTALALLCYLAADHTHLNDGPYREVVGRGLQWLREQQEANGSLMGRESMYSHGAATIAIAEAYGMTGDPRLREALEAAAAFIVRARNRRFGGWRYAPGQEGDTSVLGWQVMALVSARRAGVRVPEIVFGAARRWLRRAGDPQHRGLYAYRPPRAPTPSMTAEGMFVQHLLGVKRDEPFMQVSARYLLEHLPAWGELQSTYYWFYGTLAMYQQGGEGWRRWNEDLVEQLLEHQDTSGAAAGSWEPADMWAQVGGRVYQTAICTLMLEVYYRYWPGYLSAAPSAVNGER